jgi:hypothetical protein
MDPAISSRTRYGLSLALLLAWGLWFGALMALFVFVQVLFKMDRSVAVKAAPRMFVTFETFQLALAAICLIATAMWRLRSPRTILTAVFVLLCVASVAAIIPPIAITPKMEALRLAGESNSPQFRSLHGRTMIFYMTEAISLLVVGLMLPTVLGRASSERVSESAPASTPPADAVDQPPPT